MRVAFMRAAFLPTARLVRIRHDYSSIGDDAHCLYHELSRERSNFGVRFDTAGNT